MALSNKDKAPKADTTKKTTEAAGSGPQFEDESSSTSTPPAGGNVSASGAENPEAGTATTTNTEAPATPEAKAAATTALAKAGASSLATQDAAKAAKAFQAEMDAMRGGSDFQYGNYRVFKASNGELLESGGDEDSLGKWAKGRLMAWDNHFEVSPGEQGASTKDFVAYSKDGVTIDSVIGEEQKSWAGKPVAEYLEYLRTEEEFASAKKREFIDCAVALMATESGDGPIGTVIQITLSESSMLAFNKYQNQLKDTARAAAMGIPGFKVPEDPFTLFFVRELASKGDNKWTKVKVCQDLPTKI